MKYATKTLTAGMTAALVVAALAMSVTAASAFSLRAPQIAFSSSSLQGYLTANDGGINVLTDQQDAQAFSTGITGNTDFTLTLKTASGASLGVYNTLAASPTLYQLFPSAAVADYSVFCHFSTGGTLQASLFDEFHTFLGTTTYTGVDRTHFGFYIQSANGTWYSQDGRNGPNPQVLTYQGTGINSGDWWECFEDAPYNAATSTFTGCVLVLQSVAPVPAHSTSWGALKSNYR
jgi:hypothetical protein